MAHQLSSVFKDHIEAFIALKRKCGFGYIAEEKILYCFDRLAVEMGIRNPVISKELALEWSKLRPNEAKATRYKRCTTINQFSIYLSQNGMESTKCLAPKPKKTFVPYIYTKAETDRIISIADSRNCSKITRDSICFVMPALIRFLLCTGVRIGEALQIEDRDMDLVNNVFVLRDTKNGKERLLPITQSLSDVLSQYRKHRQRINPSCISSKFFVTFRGRKCVPGNIYKLYRKLLAEAQIPFRGNHYGPRLHDLRHTFAVRALKQMVDNGMDMYCTLPILSTYLGHQSLEATNHYVRICTEMYPDLVHNLEGVFNNVFPQLNHDFHEDDRLCKIPYQLPDGISCTRERRKSQYDKGL